MFANKRKLSFISSVYISTELLYPYAGIRLKRNGGGLEKNNEPPPLDRSESSSAYVNTRFYRSKKG